MPALRQRGLDPHVIINDYQNARVDAELLRELAESIVPISGSCVCCGSREELLGALEIFEHEPKRVVVIETNGTTDSEELIELLSLEPALAKFTQPIQLSVIDGQRWQKRFWHNSLELEQACTAGFLFISRWDDIDGKRREKVMESIAHHRVHAEEVTPSEFAEKIAQVVADVKNIPSREAPSHPLVCDCGHHHKPHESHSSHTAHHFASMQIDLPEVISRSALTSFLKGLPLEVIRVKGLARLAESPDEYHVFQRVDDSPTQWLPIGKTTRLSHPVVVLIGPEIAPEAIHALAAESFRGTSHNA
jgi:G3E family GTPase